MKNVDFYAFVGIIVPGGLLIFGLSYLFPELNPLFQGKEITFGELGLFVVLSYVAGHLAQCFGDFIEWLWWKAIEGPQTNWVRYGKEPFAPDKFMKLLPIKVRLFLERNFEKRLLSRAQIQKMPAKIREILKINCENELAQIDRTDWFYLTRQAYAVVKRVGLASRVDIFNGYWAMMRGVVASLAVLLVAGVICGKPISASLLYILAIMMCLGLLRMHRFGVHYTRELFVQFLNVLPSDLEKPAATEVNYDI